MLTLMSFEQQLDQLAQLAVKVGLNLQPGQELIATAPIEALPLARRITEHAYAAGAKLVTFIYSDDQATLARYRLAPEASFDYGAAWLYDGFAQVFTSGGARLAISGGDPMLLAGQSPDKLARASKAQSIAYSKALKAISGFEMNWSIVAYASPAWARKVFPQLPEEQAVAQLWQAIFAASRADGPDPVAAWVEHDAQLHARVEYLNQQNFASLHFEGPGTDLMLGLADGHRWAGGATLAQNGVVCNPNIPTEEVFTTPHRARVDGYVSSSKPFAYRGGTLIEGIRVKFEAGRVTEATAQSGQDTFRRLLETDPGASRLGEVALVPHSSPISRLGYLFYNTLFDENAASHLALGQAYTAECMKDGAGLSKDQLEARGANHSLVHEDWMIGTGEMAVDGITQQGARVPLMRNGVWVD